MKKSKIILNKCKVFFLNEILPLILVEANNWVTKNSSDPLQDFLTETVKDRDSIKDLIKNISLIKQEAASSLDKCSNIEGDLFFESNITNDKKWKKFYLKWYSNPSNNALKEFPKTLAIINKYRDIKLAMISLLEAGCKIHPHCGPWRGSIRVHIGLFTPNSEKCFISLNKKRYFWKDEEMVAFDDTFEHYVFNSTDKNRVILFLDVERKMKSFFHQMILKLLNNTIGRLTTRE